MRRNKGRIDSEREHLTIVGATSGDTGSAAIYGLRGKKDVSVFIMFPDGKVSPIQEAQMTTVLDENVHSVAVDGTFDDCQDLLKQLFADADVNKTHMLGAVNSINWARILAQITYYVHAYISLAKSNHLDGGKKLRFVVPTGNFGDILAGYFAKRMGLPVEKLVIATNENDILHRFWLSGHYEKKPAHGQQPDGGGFAVDGAKAHEDGVRETYSPAMDILVSSNFERLLWFLAFEVYGSGDNTRGENRKIAGQKVKGWLEELKADGGFGVDQAVLNVARQSFSSERVSDAQTLETIRSVYSHASPAGQAHAGAVNGTAGTTDQGAYILDPHSAVGIAAARRSAAMPDAGPPSTHHVALATAHPAKFSAAVELALGNTPGFTFEKLLPVQFQGLESAPRRVIKARRSDGVQELRRIIRERVPNRSE